jgi:hypothetical protein
MEKNLKRTPESSIITSYGFLIPGTCTITASSISASG